MSAGDDGPDGIAGLPVEEAVAAVEDPERDPETVRRLLERFAEEGVVSRRGAEGALAHVSKIVATPETRVEVAGDALADARDAAEAHADLDAVRARLDDFEERLSDLGGRTDELGTRLRELADRLDDAPLYEFAVAVDELARDANALQGAADELTMDIEGFERWLGSPTARYDELAEALDAVEDALAELTEALDAVEERTAASGAAPADDEPREEDPAVTWADVALQQRVMGPLLADVRAELSDLRTMADRADAAGPPAELAERLAALESTRQSAADRVDSVALPGWSDRFGDRLAAFDEALAALDPPIDWGALQGRLEEHREHLAGER